MRYTFIKNPDGDGVNQNMIGKIEDGGKILYIPKDYGNRHFQEYISWTDAGGITENPDQENQSGGLGSVLDIN